MAGLTVRAMTVRSGTSGALKTYRSLMSRSPCSECGANWPLTTVPPRAGASRWSAAFERSGAAPRVRTTSVVPRAASFRACMVWIESSSDGRGRTPAVGSRMGTAPTVVATGRQWLDCWFAARAGSDESNSKPSWGPGFGRESAARSAPEPVVRSLGIPAGRRSEPVGITRVQERFARVLVEIIEPEPWRLRHRDRPVLNERRRQAADETAPLPDIGGVVLECQEVLGRSSRVDAGKRGHGRAGHVKRHRDAVFAREVADPLGLEDAAR